MRPRTLLALARRRRVTLPADNEAGLREWFRFRDFDHFVEIYLTCSKCVRDPEDFQRLLADFALDQAAENIRYSEVHFTIGTHWQNGVAIDEVLDAMAETIVAVERDENVRIRLIPDIVRDVGKETADPTLDWALAGQKKGIVVALGLTGREALYPSEPFADHFAAAAAAGLHCVAHAGEHAGPQSVYSALDSCRAERIGHGVQSIADSGLVERLRRDRVPLEVCPTSNVCLGLAPDVAHHPFDELRRARGVDRHPRPSCSNNDASEEFLVGEAYSHTRSVINPRWRPPNTLPARLLRAHLGEDPRPPPPPRFSRSARRRAAPSDPSRVGEAMRLRSEN
jgi:adenosine deaminase